MYSRLQVDFSLSYSHFLYSRLVSCSFVLVEQSMDTLYSRRYLEGRDRGGEAKETYYDSDSARNVVSVRSYWGGHCIDCRGVSRASLNRHGSIPRYTVVVIEGKF